MFKQIEILLEGMNPEAGGPLNDQELSRVRGALAPDEHLQGYVRGRVVRGGVALWVLTDQRLLLLKKGLLNGSVTPLAWGAVKSVTLERGRYGSTVALFTADKRVSLFAADAGLARSFVAGLAAVLPAGVAPTELGRAVSAQHGADVATWVSWSRLRLLPAAPQGMVENLVLLREAATLHERGMLNEAEFGALKGRLLEAA